MKRIKHILLLLTITAISIYSSDKKKHSTINHDLSIIFTLSAIDEHIRDLHDKLDLITTKINDAIGTKDHRKNINSIVFRLLQEATISKDSTSVEYNSNENNNETIIDENQTKTTKKNSFNVVKKKRSFKSSSSKKNHELKLKKQNKSDKFQKRYPKNFDEEIVKIKKKKKTEDNQSEGEDLNSTSPGRNQK